MSAYWAIADGHGNELTTGVSDEAEARRMARRMARDRGESVYLYSSDADEGDESEEVES